MDPPLCSRIPALSRFLLPPAAASGNPPISFDTGSETARRAGGIWAGLQLWQLGTTRTMATSQTVLPWPDAVVQPGSSGAAQQIGIGHVRRAGAHGISETSRWAARYYKYSAGLRDSVPTQRQNNEVAGWTWRQSCQPGPGSGAGDAPMMRGPVRADANAAQCRSSVPVRRVECLLSGRMRSSRGGRGQQGEQGDQQPRATDNVPAKCP